MRNTYLLVLLLFGNLIYAQNTFPTTGNVGIGTTTPTQSLEIGGSRPITFNTNIGVIKMKGDLGGWAMNYGFIGSNGTDHGGLWGFGGADGLNQWSIGKNYTDNFFVVKSNGNIGIGTTDPITKLTISSPFTPSFMQLALKNVSSGEGIGLSFNETNNARRAYIYAANGNGLILGDETGYGLRVFSGGSEVMTARNNGNVGIGINAPAHKLDISGSSMRLNNSSGSAYLHITGSGATDYAGSYIYLNAGTTKLGNTFNQTRIDMNRALDSTGNYQLSRMNNATYTGIFYRYDDPSGHSFYTVPNRSSTTTNEVFRVRPDGSVGIGISAPLSKLHVKHNSTSMITIEGDGTGYGNAFTLYKANNSTNSRAMGMFMFDQGGQNEWFVGRPFSGSDAFVINRKGSLSTHSDDVSSLTNGGNPNGVTRMFTINDTGNVGIGTNTPGYKLHVEGKTRVQDAIYVKNGTLIGYIGAKSDWTGSSTLNNDLVIGSYQPNITFATNNDVAERMRISQDGNVGIGTTQPSQKLHVSGYGQFDSGIIGNSAGLLLLGSPTSTLTNSVFLTTSGALGIGVQNGTFPTGYKLAVDGNIIAEKVKVKNSNAWPDFVFKKEYKLPTLFEIEKYVNENSHLPEIPSATEVEKDGQDLGEMNRLLLKKVEELTLYAIGQEKKIKEQEEKLNKFESDNKEILELKIRLELILKQFKN